MRRVLALVLILCTVLLAPARAWESRCTARPFDDLPEVRDVVAQLAPAFATFPSLRKTLFTRITEICVIDGLFDAQGFFEPETGRVVLSATLSPGLRQAVLVHELRHVQQFGVGVCPAPDLAMRDYAEAVFAMEADASVTSLVVADQMRRAGHPEMWEALSTWPMQSDIARAYAATMAATDSVDQAAAAAFDAWYTKPARRQAYYTATCLDYLERLEKSHRLPRYESLSEQFYEDLCRLPDGRHYPCTAPD